MLMLFSVLIHGLGMKEDFNLRKFCDKCLFFGGGGAEVGSKSCPTSIEVTDIAVPTRKLRYFLLFLVSPSLKDGSSAIFVSVCSDFESRGSQLVRCGAALKFIS
jgi:hypothetical protein